MNLSGSNIKKFLIFSQKKAFISRGMETPQKYLVFQHRTIIRAGKRSKKITCVTSATQLARGLLLKKLTYFEVMLNIFEFSRM